MEKNENLYISKEIFKKTERMLYAYYSDKKEMLNIESEISVLEDNIKELEYDITHTKVNITEEECYQGSSGAEERVQSSVNAESHAEKVIIKAIEKLERERADTIGRLNGQKGKIRRIKRKYARMEDNINKLREDLQQFLKYKYQDKLSIPQIAMRLNYSDATASRRRNELVLNVAQFMHWI